MLREPMRFLFVMSVQAHCGTVKVVYVGRKLARTAPCFVIPAKAGIQAAPKPAVSCQGGALERASTAVPASALALWRGTAWIPACAGMTK